MQNTNLVFRKKGRVFLYHQGNIVDSHHFNNRQERKEIFGNYKKRIANIKNSQCFISVIYDAGVVNDGVERLERAELVKDKRTQQKLKYKYNKIQ
jgi:hypothetical protein